MFSNKLIFWCLVLGTIGLFFYKIMDVLLPFFIAVLLSYFLSPLVDWLEKKRFPRTPATIIVLSIFLFILISIIITIAPLVRNQILAFIDRIPKYSNFILNILVPSLHERVNNLSPFLAEKVKDVIQDSTSSFFGYTSQIITTLLKSGFAFVNTLSLIFISPIIAFYTLRDWNFAFAKLEKLLPPAHSKLLIEQFHQIDHVLSNFIRGQTIVCTFLATFYSIGLTFIGLDFALFIGLATGVLGFIPYVGILIGTLISLTVAFLQYGTLKAVLSVIGVFAAGQFIEGNFITPKIIGEKVGLHPVMIFLALFSAGTLFGFFGVLFAIPMAAVLGVIVRFLITLYKRSSYYKG